VEVEAVEAEEVVEVVVAKETEAHDTIVVCMHHTLG
jgi:hypothetical protein